MADIDKKKAEALTNSIKKPCKDCEAKQSMNPIMQMIMSKLSGASSSSCGCSQEQPIASRVVMVIKKPESGEPEKVDNKSGKKILEKKVEEAKHATDKFVQRCVGAITGGEPKSESDLSGAFAKCKATENKHVGKDLVKSAAKRKGFQSRKAEFVHALEKIKKHGKKT